MMTVIKPTLANLKKLAAKVGATVDSKQSGHNWDCYVDLPAGKIIDGAHGNCYGARSDCEGCIVGGKVYRFAEAKQAAIADLIEWIQRPVEDGCETDNPETCDVCNPE